MISYDQQTIGLINIFERITRASVKDCFPVDDTLYFVIQSGDLGKAIGKQGANIRKFSMMMKKQVKVIEFNQDPCRFAANLLFPIRPAEVTQDDNLILIKAKDSIEKGKIFGREKTNLKRVQEIMSKYFPVELKVV